MKSDKKTEEQQWSFSEMGEFEVVTSCNIFYYV